MFAIFNVRNYEMLISRKDCIPALATGRWGAPSLRIFSGLFFHFIN